MSRIANCMVCSYRSVVHGENQELYLTIAKQTHEKNTSHVVQITE